MKNWAASILTSLGITIIGIVAVVSNGTFANLV